MNRRSFLAASASTALATVAGCAAIGGPPPVPESAAEIRIVNNSFDPLRLSVEPGRTVVWTNAGSAAHTVDSQTFHEVAEVWSADTETLDPGESTTFTFEDAGVYEYSCSIHGGEQMCGAVLVGDASLDEPLPCEGTIGSNEGDGLGGGGYEGDGGGNESDSGGNESDGGGNASGRRGWH